MSLEAHYETLEEKRLELKEQIAREMSRPLPDFALITSLKKQKLRLKEESEALLRRLDGTMKKQASG